MTREAPQYSEAERRPGKRQGDPDDVWRVAPAPFPSSEGYRITWVHSTAKARRDETTRSERIERAPARIEALFACQFIALLCCCLIERELRQATDREQIAELPLYHEDRSCSAPTAARAFDHFADVQRHHLTRDAHHHHTIEPQLTPLQRQLLRLLGVPETANPSTPSHP